MKKGFKSIACILTLCLLACTNVNVVLAKEINYETKTGTYKIPTSKSDFERCVDSLNLLDGISDFEREKIESYAEILTWNDNEIVLESKKPLAVRTTNNGETIVYNERISFLNVALDSGNKESGATVGSVYMRVKMTYFYFESDSSIQRLLKTEANIQSGGTTINTLQMNWQGAGHQYSESSGQHVGFNSEFHNGTVYRISGNGAVMQWTTTNYYYDLDADHTSIIVNIILKLKDGTTKTVSKKL